jgi:zinc protease
LVRDKAVAQSVSAWTRDYVGPDELAIQAVLTEKAKLADVEKLVEGELTKLASTKATEAELAKVKRRVRSSFVFGLQTNLSRATRLGEFESYYGDARLLARELQHYQAVSAEDIQNAVKKYLGAERRQLIEVLPAEPPAAASAPVTPAAKALPAPATPAAKAPPAAKTPAAPAAKTPPAATAPATKGAKP